MTRGPIMGVGIGIPAQTAVVGIGIQGRTVVPGTPVQTVVRGTLAGRIVGPGILAVQTAGVGEVRLWDCA